MSIEQKNLHRKAVKSNTVVAIAILGIVIVFLALFVGMIFQKFQPVEHEQMYCHFEKDIVHGPLPRFECFNMAIHTAEMDRVNLSQFERLKETTFECSDNPMDLPACSGNKFYYSEYPLDTFCDDCEIEGKVCIQYYLIYESNDTQRIREFENQYMQQVVDTEELLNYLWDNCWGENG